MCACEHGGWKIELTVLLLHLCFNVVQQQWLVFALAMRVKRPRSGKLLPARWTRHGFTEVVLLVPIKRPGLRKRTGASGALVGLFPRVDSNMRDHV